MSGGMSGGMNVCGVLIHAHPDRIHAVEAGLGAVPGVEAHGRAAGARLIVTIEDSAKMTAADALAELNRLPGVIATALVYHEFDAETECDIEDPAPGTEEIPC